MKLRRKMYGGFYRLTGLYCWLLVLLATGLAPGQASAAEAEFVDAAGQPVLEAIVPDDLRLAVQTLVADSSHGVNLEKCALVLARAVLPGDETDGHFASVLHGKDWDGGMHFLTAGNTNNAICIRLSRFDAPCTLELTKPGYLPVTVPVPVDDIRGKIIWLGEIKMERAPAGAIPARPAVVVVPAPVSVPAVASVTNPPPNATALLPKAPAADRPKIITYEDLNQLFGVPLWASDRLWDEDGEVVRKRLGLDVESPATSESGRSSYLGFPKLKILGEEAKEMRVSCDSKQVSAVMIMFANQGDSVPTRPDPRDYKRRASDYDQALKAYELAVETLHKRIHVAGTNVEEHLMSLLGDPKNSSFGAGGATHESVRIWSWKEHSISVSARPGEGVLLRILPVQEALAKGRVETIRGSDLKEDLLSHVEHRTNGDVVVTGIPMVNQGGKGYCGKATWSRYLQYLGIPVDEYILSEAADTDQANGAGLIGATQGLIARNHRRVVNFDGPLTIARITEYIEKGLPIIWGMSAVEPFEKLAQQPNRMGDSSPEEWLETLKPNRDEARKLAKYKHLGLDSHCCLIIGYNKLTREVATSDSWGPDFRERWFPLEAAQNVSGDSYSVIHW